MPRSIADPYPGILVAVADRLRGCAGDFVVDPIVSGTSVGPDPCPPTNCKITTKSLIAGWEPSQTIEMSIAQPPELVAERLGPEPSGLAVVRRRLDGAGADDRRTLGI